MATTILSLPIPLILLINLHILEYPHANRPEYDHAIFDPQVRGLKERIKILEDIAYFLVAKIEGTAKGILGTYPCHTPSDSLTFRTSLSKYLEALRHACIYPTSSKNQSGARPASTAAPGVKTKAKPNSGKELQTNDSPASLALGWWWKDVIVRKSLLEECHGDRFERLLLSLSTHALALSVSKSKRSTINSFEQIEPEAALQIHPTTYFALLAQSKVARYAWAQAASVLIQSEAELSALKNRLASQSNMTTETKYSALPTPALIAFVKSRRQDLLRTWASLGFQSGGDKRVHRLKNRQGNEELALQFLEKAIGVEQPKDEAQNLDNLATHPTTRTPAQDQDQSRLQPQLEILPLPVAAAHHPTHLKKLRKPIFLSPLPGHSYVQAAAASMSSSMNASTFMPAHNAAATHTRIRADMYLSEQYGPALKQMHAALGNALSRIREERARLDGRKRGSGVMDDATVGSKATQKEKKDDVVVKARVANVTVSQKPKVTGSGKGRPIINGKPSTSVSGKTTRNANAPAMSSLTASRSTSTNANAKKGNTTSSSRVASGKLSSSTTTAVVVGKPKVTGTLTNQKPKSASKPIINATMTAKNANGLAAKDSLARSRLKGGAPGKVGRDPVVAKSAALPPRTTSESTLTRNGATIASTKRPTPAGSGQEIGAIEAENRPVAIVPTPVRIDEDPAELELELKLDLWEPSAELELSGQIIEVDFNTEPTPALIAAFGPAGAGLQEDEKTLEQRIDEIRERMLPAYPPVPDVSTVVRLPYAELGSEEHASSGARAGRAYGGGKKTSESSKIPRVGASMGHETKRDAVGEKQDQMRAIGKPKVRGKEKPKPRKSIRLSLAAHAQCRPSAFDPASNDDDDYAVTNMIDTIDMHNAFSPALPSVSSNTSLKTSTLNSGSSDPNTLRTQPSDALNATAKGRGKVKVNRIFTSTSKAPKIGRGALKESSSFPDPWMEPAARLPSLGFETDASDEDANSTRGEEGYRYRAELGEKSMTLKEILLSADVSVTGYALLSRGEDSENNGDVGERGVGEESFEWE
ncbi:hypothetical protein H0H92_007576 [Tricholoma furcatifolium]|nr:hypothetical protein H0H92_007576 [Tricholoma furcatifolium]